MKAQPTCISDRLFPHYAYLMSDHTFHGNHSNKVRCLAKYWRSIEWHERERETDRQRQRERDRERDRERERERERETSSGRSTLVLSTYVNLQAVFISYVWLWPPREQWPLASHILNWGRFVSFITVLRSWITPTATMRLKPHHLYNTPSLYWPGLSDIKAHGLTFLCVVPCFHVLVTEQEQV
jgi:hypothetical protein